MNAAIAALDEPHRSLVVLREVNQLSYDEIAEVMCLSLAQVKTYLHRARRSLRAELEEFKP